MGQRSEIAGHLVRTVVLCLVGAALFIAAFQIMFYFRVHPYVMFGVLLGAITAWVYFSARWHPYWAPIAKQVCRTPWVREDGAKMVTIVELAIVQANTVRSETYRISIYELPGLRRVRRCLIGDDAVFLGVFQTGLWFYIHDRFHARKDGLACLDPRSGNWLYHQPKSQVEFIESVPGQPGVIDVLWNGTPQRLELNQLELSPNARDANV